MIYTGDYTSGGGDYNGKPCCSMDSAPKGKEYYIFFILVLNFASNLYSNVMTYVYRHTTMLHFSFLRQ